MRAITERDGLTSLQTVYNLLEQAPGAEFLELAYRYGVGVIARVPTSSGLLEGHLTPEHTFEGNDHRRHRPRSWLIEGLQKVDQLEFLTRDGERTLAQAAFKYVLAQPAIGCVVHTVNTAAQLDEWRTSCSTKAWPTSSSSVPAPRASTSGRPRARRTCPTSTRTSWPSWTRSTRPASGSARPPEPPQRPERVSSDEPA